MIRRFCDECGKEITPANAIPEESHTSWYSIKTRLTAKLGTLKIQVMTFKENVSDTGDFCKYCILDALRKLDDRPRPVL